MTEQQPPTVYQYSVKLECDQKCVKPSVHVYGDNPYDTHIAAVHLLKATIERLKIDNFTVAPLEIKEK